MSRTDLRTGVVGELGTKAPARVATTANITLEGEQTINGVNVVADDIVLVRSQTDATENGVYIASTSAWARAVWFDDELDAVPGTLVITVEGTLFPNTLWETVCADNPINFGTSEITFNFFLQGGSSNQFLLAGNNLSDVANVSTSRTNLGLAIGSDVQAHSSKLDTLAGLSSVANLSALAGLTGAANKIPSFTGAGAMALIDSPVNATTAIQGISFLPKQITVSNGTDTQHDINFTAGNFIFSDGSGMATVSALTKQADNTWAASTTNPGNPTGGMASGISLPTSGTVHMFALANASGSLADFGFDTDVSATNLIADSAVTTFFGGTPKFLLIASLMTDGSANIRNGIWKFRNDGTYTFFYSTKITSFSGATPATGTTLSITTPAGIEVGALFTGNIAHSGAACLYELESIVNGLIFTAAAIGNVASSRSHLATSAPIITNTSSQIKHGRNGSFGPATVALELVGWETYKN